jgi:hypothetical protein
MKPANHSPHHNLPLLANLLLVVTRYPRTLSSAQLGSPPPSSASSTITTQLWSQSNEDARDALMLSVLQEALDLTDATQYLFDEDTF